MYTENGKPVKTSCFSDAVTGKPLTSADIEKHRALSPKRPCLREITPTPYLDKLDPLIHHYGLDFLLTHGYVNLPSIPAIDPAFGYGKHTTPAVAYRQYKWTGSKADDEKVVLPVEKMYYIHPIFSRDMWEIHEFASRSMPHWDALKPVWQLATLMLEEKVMSGFLCGMLDKSKHCELRETFDDGWKMYSFEAKQNPTQQELWELWETIWNLKDVVKFGAYEESDQPHFTFGETRCQTESPGLTPIGKGSKILVNEDILSILCSKTRPKEDSAFDKIDEDSCRLRLRYQLATTLVHELVHSLWFAHFGLEFYEPFYRDYRYAETGWTYECILAGGAISAISGSVTSPYGIKIEDWPGTGQRPAGNSFLSRTPLGIQAPEKFEYHPIPMAWLPKHFTQHFWDEVERFGKPAINCPRSVHSAEGKPVPPQTTNPATTVKGGGQSP